MVTKVLVYGLQWRRIPVTGQRPQAPLYLSPRRARPRPTSPQTRYRPGCTLTGQGPHLPGPGVPSRVSFLTRYRGRTLLPLLGLGLCRHLAILLAARQAVLSALPLSSGGLFQFGGIWVQLAAERSPLQDQPLPTHPSFPADPRFALPMSGATRPALPGLQTEPPLDPAPPITTEGRAHRPGNRWTEWLLLSFVHACLRSSAGLRASKASRQAQETRGRCAGGRSCGEPRRPCPHVLPAAVGGRTASSSPPSRTCWDKLPSSAPETALRAGTRRECARQGRRQQAGGGRGPHRGPELKLRGLCLFRVTLSGHTCV